MVLELLLVVVVRVPRGRSGTIAVADVVVRPGALQARPKVLLVVEPGGAAGVERVLLVQLLGLLDVVGLLLLLLLVAVSVGGGRRGRSAVAVDGSRAREHHRVRLLLLMVAVASSSIPRRCKRSHRRGHELPGVRVEAELLDARGEVG